MSAKGLEKSSERENSFQVDVELRGERVSVDPNCSILAAILERQLDASPEMMCGMGSCYVCVVVRNGRESVRSCITQVKEGESYDW